MKYFFKLKTNEKIMCTLEELKQYLHNYGGDFITVKTQNGWVSFFRDNVLLAGAIEVETRKGKKHNE